MLVGVQTKLEVCFSFISLSLVFQTIFVFARVIKRYETLEGHYTLLLYYEV